MATATRRSKAGPSRLAAAAQSRYVDALRVARGINAFGQGIKIAGVFMAIAVYAGIASSPLSGGIAIVAALLIVSFSYVIGVLVAAHGQLLKAAVDTAINSSPFLSVNQKAVAMSLVAMDDDVLVSDIPAFTGDAASAPASSNDAARIGRDGHGDFDEDGEVVASPFCHHCGADVSADATLCAACGKRL